MSRVVLSGEPMSAGSTTLRPWRDTDISGLVAACQDPDISRWTSVPNPYCETDARAFLLQRFNAIDTGTAAPFAIVERSSPQLLGSIALGWIDWHHARGEVGYWLAGAARGQGHATTALQLICEWGFRTLRLQRIELLAATGNPASQRVAGRAGFRREALLRSYMRGNGGRDDMVAFSLLPTDSRSAAD